MITTFNTSNPPLGNWIREELPILHQSEKMKDLLPYISLVTRQDKNIAQTVIRARHSRGANTVVSPGPSSDNHPSPVVNPPPVVHPPPGNHKMHSNRCMACKRMTDGRQSYRSS